MTKLTGILTNIEDATEAAALLRAPHIRVKTEADFNRLSRASLEKAELPAAWIDRILEARGGL